MDGGAGEAKASSDIHSSDEVDEFTWIEWFCKLKGNKYFVLVDEEFIRDDFNLTGIHSMLRLYDRALDVILDNDDDDDSNSEDARELEQSALQLYGLIHARFILTRRGLQIMREKFNLGLFGTCPNVYCQGQRVLPIGLCDQPHVKTAKIFCPLCNEAYHPKDEALASIDGAYFGTTFPHLFCMMTDDVRIKIPVVSYEPRVFGFKVHPGIKDKLRLTGQAALVHNARIVEKGDVHMATADNQEED